MVNVAIAGGSSATLGHSVVSAIVATNGKHTPIILSRKKAGDDPESSISEWTIPGTSPSATVQVETRYVDYTSHDSLVQALKHVDTVLSVLGSINPQELVSSQINLLHAAEEAGCRRFAPSQFAGSIKSHSRIEFDATAKLPVVEAVRKSSIDSAFFPCGMFMNYLAVGSPNKESLAGFSEGPFLINLVDAFVDVPLLSDRGNSDNDNEGYPLVFMTDIRDIGRFLAAALDIEEPWGKRELGMVGSMLRLDALIALCEKYTGRKLERRLQTKEQLQEKHDQSTNTTVDGFLNRMFCELMMAYCDDDINAAPELNKLCTTVNPTSAEEFLCKCWT